MPGAGKSKSKLKTAAKLLMDQPAPQPRPLKARKRRLLSEDASDWPMKLIKASQDPKDVVGYLIGSLHGHTKVKISISLKHYALIGRHASCDLVIPSQKVSNFHLRLYAVRTDTRYSIVALQDLSTNGFTLNGVPQRSGESLIVQEKDLGSGRRSAILVHGDKIELPGWDGLFVFQQSPRHFELHLSPNNICFDRTNASHSRMNRHQGASATINLARHTPTSALVAVKTVCKREETDSAKIHREREVKILKYLPSHPGINQLLDAFEDHQHVHIALELVTGGDLFTYVTKHANDGLGENEVKWIGYQMLEAVGWLHKNGVAHRDLKAENILIHTSAAYPRILIADFGLSILYAKADKRKPTIVGTPCNLSPELLAMWYTSHNYEIESSYAVPEEIDWALADMWAIGVLLFTCFVIWHPFDFDADPDAPGSQELLQEPKGSLRRSKPNTGIVEHLKSNQATVMRILQGEFEWYPEERWSLLSEQGKRFIRSLIEPNVKKRLTLRAARSHGWMQCSKHDLQKLWMRVVLGGEVVGLARK